MQAYYGLWYFVCQDIVINPQHMHSIARITVLGCVSVCVCVCITSLHAAKRV